MVKNSISSKKIVYTNHALDRMDERGMTKKDIEMIRDYGRTVKINGTFYEVHLGKKGSSLVAIFDNQKEELILLTTYRE